MAQLQYSGIPESAPQGTAPEDYQHEQASPEAFGGGVAAGIENVGEGLTKQAGFYDQVAANDATNNTLQGVTNLLYGDPSKKVLGPDGKPTPDTGYFGLRGADAMRAREDISKKMDDIIAENASNLSMSPVARQAYENDTRRYRAQWDHEVGSHADQQQRVWSVDTNNTSAMIALNSLARDPTNPKSVAFATDAVRQALVRNAQISGEDASGAILKADQQVALMQIQSLLPTDPLGAKKLLDDKKGLLASLPAYDGLSDRVLARSRDVTAHAVADMALLPTPGKPLPRANSLSDAILGQESGGNANAPTSVTGATGAYQIQPATFQRYAKPGEVITNPADNARVGQRIVADLEHKYPNDPARSAVAYFSGEGNVSPPGSPTPWLVDKSDPTGKSVSAYVSDIRNRLGEGSGKPQSQADFYRQNFGTLQDKARQDYLAAMPGDNEGADRAASLADTKMRAFITQDDMHLKADYHALDAAATKPGANGQLPITVDQLLQNNPSLRDGWENLQLTNPYAAQNFENHLLKANAMPANTTYGNSFYDLYGKVATGQIKDPSVLLPYIDAAKGDASPLTKEGYGELKGMIGAMVTPQGSALSRAEADFFNRIRPKITLTNQNLNMADGVGDKKFNQFMIAALGRVRAEAASGAPPAKIFDPKGDVAALAQQYMMTMTEAATRQITSFRMPANFGGANPNAPDLSSPDGLKKAVASGLLTRDKAIEIGVQKGWIAAPPPPVPTPH